MRVYLRLWCVHVCVVCLLELVIRVLADVIRVLDDSVPGEPRRSVGGMHVKFESHPTATAPGPGRTCPAQCFTLALRLPCRRVQRGRAGHVPCKLPGGLCLLDTLL